MKNACVLFLLLHLQKVWTDGESQSLCHHAAVSQGFNLPKYMYWMSVNDVSIFYHDSNKDSKMPCPDWLSTTAGQWQWKRIHSVTDRKNYIITLGFESAVQHFNRTDSLADSNIYEGHGCCYFYPNGTYKAKLTHLFNGKDFVSFDFDRKTFVAVFPEAVVYKHLRDRDEVGRNEISLAYGKIRCLEQLNMFKHDPRVHTRKVPEVRIFEKQKTGSITVTCHVTGFYPQAVQVDWLGPDLHPVDGGVTDVLPNEDGTYQTRKSVTVPEEDVGKHTYSCVVLHSSVAHNITTVWVGEKHTGIAVWTSLACICFLAAGTGFLIWWRCRTRDAVI
ncbi:class I histocompatibility antigen, F10 alpha chain-like [Colossoma macropomum]|uniref:class I histocompatibility antigen, F10 alpha chain-like n=1 Tax=Colossoma macropomum TaxID=42526 RepID=UPI001864CA5A|nr:class I histocompatibility antigen, F10 alpha chain-like [Colossoma macropomum]